MQTYTVIIFIVILVVAYFLFKEETKSATKAKPNNKILDAIKKGNIEEFAKYSKDPYKDYIHLRQLYNMGELTAENINNIN